MNIPRLVPHPVPPPLTETTGRLTLTLAVIINADLDQVPQGPEGPADGARTAHLIDQAFRDATLPAGCSLGATLLQLAVHAP